MAPPRPVLRARVKTLRPAQGFGFLTDEHGVSRFFHVSQLFGADIESLLPGERVYCEPDDDSPRALDPARGGPRANNVWPVRVLVDEAFPTSPHAALAPTAATAAPDPDPDAGDGGADPDGVVDAACHGASDTGKMDRPVEEDPPAMPRDPHPTAHDPHPDPTDCLAEGVTGTVRTFFPDKGFGFIVTDAPGPDVFVHASALTTDRRDGPQMLYARDRVRFDLAQGPKGLRAANVTVEG